jgi:hypothetical protein
VNPVKLRRLYRHLTFAEGVAAVWSALAAVSVGLVAPLVVVPQVWDALGPGQSLDQHARWALNPWLGHFCGALAGCILLAALFWPLRQELSRLLLILSLVMSLATGFFTSWALQGVFG